MSGNKPDSSVTENDLNWDKLPNKGMIPRSECNFCEYICELFDYDAHNMQRNTERFLTRALTLIKKPAKGKLLKTYENYIDNGEYDSENPTIKILFSMYDFRDKIMEDLKEIFVAKLDCSFGNILSYVRN